MVKGAGAQSQHVASSAGRFQPVANGCATASNPLHLDVLVVDEASMIDLPMMARLIDALPGGLFSSATAIAAGVGGNQAVLGDRMAVPGSMPATTAGRAARSWRRPDQPPGAGGRK